MSSANFLPFCTGGIISSIVCFPVEFVFAFRADFRLAPSQWQTSLQSDDVSRRLGANLELALTFILLTWLPPPFRSPSERGLQGSVHRRHQIGRVSCATPSWGHQHVSQWEEGLFRVLANHGIDCIPPVSLLQYNYYPNSLPTGKCGCKLELVIFKLLAFLSNFPQLNAARSHWWLVTPSAIILTLISMTLRCGKFNNYHVAVFSKYVEPWQEFLFGI